MTHFASDGSGQVGGSITNKIDRKQIRNFLYHAQFEIIVLENDNSRWEYLASITTKNEKQTANKEQRKEKNENQKTIN